MADNTLHSIILAAAQVFEPVIEVNSPERLAVFLRRLGYELPFDFSELDSITTMASAVETLVNEAYALAYAEETSEVAIAEIAQQLTELMGTAKALADELIVQFRNNQADFTGSPLDNPDVFFLRLIDLLVYTYLDDYQPRTFAVLHLMGVLEKVEQDNYRLAVVNWKRLPEWLSRSPREMMDKVYHWDSLFDVYKFMDRLQLLMDKWPLPGDYYPLPNGLGEKLGLQADRELRMPLIGKSIFFPDYTADNLPEELPLGYAELGLGLIPDLFDAEGQLAPSLFLYPYLFGNLAITDELSDRFRIQVRGALELNKGLGLRIQPPANVTLIQNFLDNESVLEDGVEGNLKLSLIYGSVEQGQLNYIFGGAKGSHLAFNKADVSLYAAITSDYKEVGAELNIDQLTLTINTEQGDGFIQKILAGIKVESESDLTVGISSLDGFYFKGSSALEVTIPLHKKLGPVVLHEILLALAFGDPLEFTAGVSLAAQIGPVTAAVDRIGIKLPIKQSEDFDLLDIQFLPPTGAGLAINAGILYGGGYLDVDPDNQRYAGILALRFGSFDLVAVGLIATRMPDGSKGFSMLVSIGVIFMPPIQLSYGFTLSGVGGLLGIHRRMVVEAIEEGVQTGAVDSIMFPTDPIANADRIISDLRTIFPPKENSFVLAPFVKIGWGTPNIIQVDLGIFLEFPFKGRIILIGKFAAVLPESEEAVLALRVDVFGNFDFANQRIFILGTLRDSKLLSYPLRGDFAFLLSWGQEPVFLMSAGGFHPRFPQPANFPVLKRIGLDLSSGPNFQLYANSYYAITSNSYQFGASAELHAKYGGADIDGFLAYDVFLQFSPFSFAAGLVVKVSIRYKGRKLAGASLDLSLSGPTPWNARGTASVSIWIWEVDVDFNFTWGQSDARTISSINPWPLLKADLTADESWGFSLAADVSQPAMLRSTNEIIVEPVDEGAEAPQGPTIFLPPHAWLEVREKVLPLNMPIDKLGNAPVEQHHEFTVDTVTINDTPITDDQWEFIEEDLARGQFLKLSDQEKLGLPAFEKFPAGIRIRPTQLQTEGKLVSTVLTFENILIKENRLSDNKGPGNDTTDWTRANRKLRRQAWGQLSATERMQRTNQRATPAVSIELGDTYRVTSKNELGETGDEPTFTTFTAAEQYRRSLETELDTVGQDLQVIRM